MDVLKGLKQYLKASPDETLLPEQANLLLEKLDVQMDINDDESLRHQPLQQSGGFGAEFRVVEATSGAAAGAGGFDLFAASTGNHVIILGKLEKWLGSCKVGKWLQVLLRLADR
ncbi:hypothetical protein HanRHA438_Chr01g0011161 [Helianthus annuus]|nr:hypothetical protein HanRHA438_Chr01g0011161 [Helianthus annuus]